MESTTPGSYGLQEPHEAGIQAPVRAATVLSGVYGNVCSIMGSGEWPFGIDNAYGGNENGSIII